LAKSWYIFFFQLPVLPERAMRAHHFGFLLRTLREEPLVAGAFDERDLNRYAEAYDQPGALTAMTNYYRAMFRTRERPTMKVIDAPVLVVWGERDPHLNREMATPDPKLAPNARVEFIADASHWVQHERPERVSSLLIHFLREADGAKKSA
jgi:pimeloyl-ACP methyl ester carboxylesterase